MRSSSARPIALCAILVATALVLGYVERFLPLPQALPGIKLGLGNISVLLALYLLDLRYAAAVCLTRVLSAGLLYAGFSGFFYSLGGAVLSLAAMALTKRFCPCFSVLGVSLSGAFFHNIGQLVVAAAVTGTLSLFSYLPFLLVSAAVTGTLTGIAARGTLQALRRIPPRSPRPPRREPDT